MEVFSPCLKNKKNRPRRNFLYTFIKKLLTFSQKKAVLIFQDLKISQLKSLKNFSKESCSFILGNGNPETIPGIFSKETFFYNLGNRNIEKSSLYFRKQNVFHISGKVFSQSRHIGSFSYFRKRSPPTLYFFSNIAAKEKTFF